VTIAAVNAVNHSAHLKPIASCSATLDIAVGVFVRTEPQTTTPARAEEDAVKLERAPLPRKVYLATSGTGRHA